MLRQGLRPVTMLMKPNVDLTSIFLNPASVSIFDNSSPEYCRPVAQPSMIMPNAAAACRTAIGTEDNVPQRQVITAWSANWWSSSLVHVIPHRDYPPYRPEFGRRMRGSFRLQLRGPIQNDVQLRGTSVAFRFLDANEMLAVRRDGIIVPSLRVPKLKERPRGRGQKCRLRLDRDTHQGTIAADGATSKEELMAVCGPPRPDAAFGRNLPLARRFRRERPHVDLGPSRLDGLVGHPLPVGRNRTPLRHRL